MILVTGGTGLVGSHLLYNLTTQGYQVKATYRSKEKLDHVKHIFSYYTKNIDVLFSKIEWIKADITDIPSLNFAFKDVTQVYHCAALISFDPKDYYDLRCVNIEGTANVVNLCISNSVKKLCYVSSIATIDDDHHEFTNEETVWNPELDHSVYAITKYGAEMEVWRGSQEGLEVVIVNPGIILGPGFWSTGSGSLFKRIWRGLSHYTHGVTGYIDVKDVAKIMKELMNSSFKNERYILVSENLTFKYVFESIASTLSVIPPKKEVSKFLLEIGWRLDWLQSHLRGKRRKLTKQVSASLLKDSRYDTSKIKNTINISFIPISDSIEEYANYFLKDLMKQVE